jgi:hypothetical protein
LRDKTLHHGGKPRAVDRLRQVVGDMCRQSI